MITLFIAIALLVGAGGTVAASDSSRPGDLLFPVDRLVEEARVTFASAEGKTELKVKFAEERLDEMDSIIDNEPATTTPNGMSEVAQQNLSQALDILTAHLADIHNSASSTPPGILQAISVIEDRLQSRVGSLPQELKIKIRDDRGRIELKTEEGKIKVKIDSDGEIEVEIEEEDDDSDDDSNKGSSSNSGSGKNATSTKSDDDDEDDNTSGLEIEADVFTDTTVVEVEIGGQKSSFTTSAKTRAAIVAEIVSRYPLFLVADVEAALELEVEDRASTSDDTEDDSDDDNSGSSDDDDEDLDDNEDEEEDEDNSGSSN